MSVFVPALIVLAVLGVALYLVSRRKLSGTDRPDAGVSPTIQRIRANVRAILRQKYPSATVTTEDAPSLDPRLLVVTVTVRGDRERDRLLRDTEFRERFRQALVDADYPKAAISEVTFRAESEETLNREAGGSRYQGQG